MKYQELPTGIKKRTKRRVLGLFIDGTGLDRATRRIKRKVNLRALVRGVTSGIEPIVARYYTLIPYEDDSRQRAFLDAVNRAGLSVIVKRLPPKGVSRQVSVEAQMSADIIAFALGHFKFSDLSEYKVEQEPLSVEYSSTAMTPEHEIKKEQQVLEKAKPTEEIARLDDPNASDIEKIITVVCPAKDVAYAISLAAEFGVDTVTADFGKFNSSDLLKSAAKWIDLSDSETIWRE